MSDVSSGVHLYSNLMSEIPIIVRTRWNEREAPSVLAWVGTVIGPDARRELEMAGGKLKSFVLLHMRDQVRYIYIYNVGDCVAPLPESQLLADTELVNKYHVAHDRVAHRTAPFSSKRRFNSTIWRAFTLQFGTEKRYIDLSDNNHIKILDVNNTLPEDRPHIHEVLKSDLSLDEDGYRLAAADASRLITAWAERNSIALEALYERSVDLRPANEATLHANTPAASDVVDMLMRVFSTLTASELSRIHIPADIVMKVLSTNRRDR
jgi:hypothetical protein